MTFQITYRDALIVVDLQNDFLPGGALAVPGGDEIIPGINGLMKKFHHHGARIVLTQDWHPETHLSFADRHTGKAPFDPIKGVPGIGPVLWPAHCIQGTAGAEFHGELAVDLAHLMIRKGFHEQIDSYSTFTENDGETDTGLSGYLTGIGVNRIFLCGLAFDYCVFHSAMDGMKKGFETAVIPEFCRYIAEDSARHAEKGMTDDGIRLLTSRDF
jgi:nicotinamidase/pyrazinamidase